MSLAYRVRFVAGFVGAAALGLSTTAFGQAEPAACRSPDPADWPPSAKPYFMLAVDTSGSMTTCLNGNNVTSCSNSSTSTCNSATNSCGMPDTRIDGAKCALSQTVDAFSGLVNFGLAGFGGILSNCPSGASCTACNPGVRCDCRDPAPGGSGFDNFDDNGDTFGCNLTPLPNASNNGENNLGCGNRPDSCTANGGGIYAGAPFGANWSNGGSILVPMLQDPGSIDSNAVELLDWFDRGCGSNRELWANGSTPLGGILRTVEHYYAFGWDPRWGDANYCATNPFGAGGLPYPRFPSPVPGLNAGNPVPDCRSLNVILVTDGEDTCDGTGPAVAQSLFNRGINTFVIGFANSGTTATNNFNAIADMGDDGQPNDSRDATLAANETQLAQELARIISGAVQPETCNNLDDNCNGCTDEGSKVWCNRNKTPRTVAQLTTAGNIDQCCSGARATCIQNFEASISASNPDGDQWWLPCWNPATDNVDPHTKWVCSDPGEACDEDDNNCETSITPASLSTNIEDEGYNKCPNCPAAETCDGLDENCDGVVDNAPGNPNPFTVTAQCVECIPSIEICNGCDDDCDGDIDEGVPPVSCGLATPAQCSGTQTCVSHTAPGGFGDPGECLAGGGTYGACSNNPGTETCNGIDDDCDGIVDDNPTDDGGPCGGTTVGACEPGTEVCQNGTLVCIGYQGPTLEICDTIDNDCDGSTDENTPPLPGTGQECGAAIGVCTKGTTSCVGGEIVCTGGVMQDPEICNGLDDDCNGQVDDGILDDAPTNAGCWPLPVGTCSPACGHGGTSWCPPAGATCTGLGTLDAPCTPGTLRCEGLSGWECSGSRGPSGEVCDGADNDCDSETDEVGELGAPIGETCGSDVGECIPGTNICDNGSIVCDGEMGPAPELCDGLDNDCDTEDDNGIPIGEACQATYDTGLYPGTRDQGECNPGHLECDGSGAQVCVGGKGPEPEVCDGLDNDCDGQVDESGMAPDGINGTADPDDPTRILGEPCGVDEGECTAGDLGCINGRIECVGGVGPQPESCDCQDNDCDGEIDEDAEVGEEPICSEGKTCVELAAAGACQCAEPCRNSEFPCPTGFDCVEDATRSGTDVSAGRVCLRPDVCENCEAQTVVRPDGTIECGPSGTSAGGRPIAVCTCKGDGCHSPCNGVQCESGFSCSPVTAECEDENNCFYFGCPPGEACSANRVCVDNPCEADSCPAGEVCRPNGTFTEFACVGSCAGVQCQSGEECHDGECVDSPCGAACPGGEVCLEPVSDAGAPMCGASLCGPDTCLNGEYCDPATGRCGEDPCSGVLCPTGQLCSAGECVSPPAPPMPDGGMPEAGTGGGPPVQPDGSAGSNGSGGSGGDPPPKRSVFGLATGGGGCSCDVPGGSRSASDGALVALVGLAVSVAFRRRKTSRSAVVGGAR